jgi:hypothetical protein
VPTSAWKYHALHEAPSFDAGFFLASFNVQHKHLFVKAAVVIDAQFARIGKQEHVAGSAKIFMVPKGRQFNIVLIFVLN